MANSVLALLCAIVVTVVAASHDLLFWSVVPSALIHTVIFFVLGRLGFAIGRRFYKKAGNSAQDS
jgi:hypothetical protein